MDIFSATGEKILVGLLSGFIVWLLSNAKQFIKNKKLEKLYPIAGEYITEYEDEINGKVVICSAPATIHQNGQKIHGETIFGGNRKWVVEGEISRNGHLYGIYYANNPHDKSVGNFFLYINPDDSMDGLWGGYDSSNRKINYGKYIFHPVCKDFMPSKLSEKYLPAVIAISDRLLGKNYLTIDMLRISVSDNEDKHFGYIAVKNNEVIGFCLHSVFTNEEFKKTVLIPEEEIPKAINYSPIIGLLQTIAVKKQYQKQGIGTALVKQCISDLEEKSTPVITAVGWRSTKGVNIEGVLLNLGFVKMKEVKDYWKEDSLEKKYKCHDCGDPPCTCEAVIYAKF
jgi:ribosomal protein S18 acetylase RimI-like enzyme